MIDIHTHILPCYDDGSKSLEMSRQMLRDEIDNGVNTVVLTPHQNIEKNEREEINRRFNEFKENVKDLNINLLLGCEIYYHERLVSYLKEGRYQTINNSKYILVEFSTRIETPIADVVYELVIAGYKPIIAHIERYGYLTNDDYFEIKRNGALIQVNSKSFSEHYHLKKLKFLLKNELLDFISSDAHNISERNVEFDISKKFIQKHFKKQYNKLFEADFNFND